MRQVFGAAHGVALGAAWLAVTSAASGRDRPFFEPTDVEMESSGQLEVDLQVGSFRTRDGTWRHQLPDVEVDVGLAPGIEVDVDVTLSTEAPPGKFVDVTRARLENVWAMTKLGLWNTRDEGTGRAWAMLVQAGPRLPTARGATGVGAEGLLLLGRTWPGQHMVLNVGGFVDPRDDGQPRARGVEAGIDVDYDLTRGGGLSLLGELGGTRSLRDDDHQLHATMGLSWAATDALTISTIGFVGLLPSNERFGLMLGVTPNWRLWGD